MFPAGFKITTEMLWRGAFYFAAIDSVFVPILASRINRAAFRNLYWALGLTTAVFWCALWTGVLACYWDSVYSYVFPAWVRWLIPPTYGLLFAGVNLLFWQLALRLRGNAVISFCLLGGLWGLITHLLAVSLGIVDKPPVLQGASPAAAVSVAIFEFTFYWCVILTAAVLIQRGWQRMRRTPL
jgi:hypothetical protein